MTRSELVSAYESGRINRRALIKGLTAAGLSLTVATAMADKLRAAPAPAGRGKAARNQDDDTYGPTDPVEEEPITELPNTGIGDDSDKKNLAPIAVLGGAAALVASRIRRTKPSDVN